MYELLSNNTIYNIPSKFKLKTLKEKLMLPGYFQYFYC